MDLFWFFVMPHGVASWYIEPLNGQMNGFRNFYPLKEDTFRNAASLLPAQKDYVVIQRLAAESLKEGEEYIIWFRSRDHAPAPLEISLALNYRQDKRKFEKWEDLTDIARLLGLDPARKKVDGGLRAF